MALFNPRIVSALRIVPALLVAAQVVSIHSVRAAAPGCSQTLVDGTTAPATASYIYPSQPVVPFYQWENNNGYCGEVSMMQGGMSSGQWMSQFNARLVCGTGLSQSGPGGWCGAHRNHANYNAQLLIEDPGTGVTGPATYASAAACLANSRLAGSTYPYTTGFHAPNVGIAGYKDYMSWIKSEMIAGRQVTIAMFYKYGNEDQYDHEVTVMKIGTNHSPADSTYYDDDVLYFDDHGVYNLVDGKLRKDNPAIPFGAGSDMKGCTPYVFGYKFSSLPLTRAAAKGRSAPAYSILIPGMYPTRTQTGADGAKGAALITGHNYAFSIGGAIDKSAGGPFLLPVRLSIAAATASGGAPNPKDPVAAWQYENSMIGTSLTGDSCTNDPPSNWMSPLTLEATIGGLTAGVTYNLYEYDFSGISGTGSAAALAVPTANFNANRALATHATSFTATGPAYTQTVTRTSDQIVVFRAVPAAAP